MSGADAGPAAAAGLCACAVAIPAGAVAVKAAAMGLCTVLAFTPIPMKIAIVGGAVTIVMGSGK